MTKSQVKNPAYRKIWSPMTCMITAPLCQDMHTADQKGGRWVSRGEYKVFVGHNMKPSTEKKNCDNSWLWLQKITMYVACNCVKGNSLRGLLVWFTTTCSTTLTVVDLRYKNEVCTLVVCFLRLQRNSKSFIVSLAIGLLLDRVDTLRDWLRPSVSIRWLFSNPWKNLTPLWRSHFLSVIPSRILDDPTRSVYYRTCS